MATAGMASTLFCGVLVFAAAASGVAAVRDTPFREDGTQGESRSRADSPPNIIHIVVDDVGWNDVGYRDSALRTPNIDSLAKNGVILNDFNAFKICSPSRSSFMTGRYPYHIGQQTNLNLNPSDTLACGINLNYTFIPELLRMKQNYSTHAIGKWHLGYFKKEYTPTYRGFDTFLGYYSAAETHYTHISPFGVPLWWTPSDNDTTPLPGCHLVSFANNTGTNLGIVRGQNGTYLNDILTKEALRVINNKKDDAAPLYMYIALQNNHVPMEAPESYIKMNAHIEDPNRRLYAAMASALDDAIGNITSALKDTGRWNNTVLIFNSDNGAEIDAPTLPVNYTRGGSVYPLRGGKFSFFQGGIRVPAFISSPLLKWRGEFDGMMHAVDLYSTVAGIAGIETSELNTGPVPEDSFNMWNVIRNQEPGPRVEMVINIDNTPQKSNKKGMASSALRVGPYKLLVGFPGYPDGWQVPYNSTNYAIDMEEAERKSGTVLPCSVTPCLFNVIDDPEERHNLALELPDVLSEMKDRLEFYAKTEVSVEDSGLCPDPPNGGWPNACEVCSTKGDGGYWFPWAE